MKTFLETGIIREGPFLEEEQTQFYVRELKSASPESYVYPGDSIKYELDAELVALYDRVRDTFFPDTNQYYQEASILPLFVQEAGQNSDCALTSVMLNKLLQDPHVVAIPNLYRHLYLVDCQFLIGAIQNHISGMEYSFINYYIQLAYINEPAAYSILSSPNSTIFVMSPESRSISALLESYFVKAYSILDMLCKLGYELELPEEDFSKYRTLRSANLLWGEKKKLKINGCAGTLFEQCDLIHMIESLRNEVVHNGTWELNPKVFLRYEEGHIAERFMLFPDTNQGRLTTVKNRRHFFGDNIQVNKVLPSIHLEFQQRLLETVKQLNVAPIY